MATVYIQPGTGTGSGTEASPYYFSELSTAESTAGTNGKILFTDGDYSITGVTTFAGASGLTYESLNPHGANLKTSVSTTLRKMIIGGQTTPVTFKNFKTEQCYFQFDNAGNSTNASTITGCYITYPVAVSWTGSTVSLVRSSSTVQSDIHQFTNNVAKIPFTGTGDHRIMQGANMEVIGCTFDLITSGGGLNSTDLNLAYGPPTTLNRNIWVCDDDSIFAATGNANFDADIANYSTNSSFYQMGSINDSGGTNNLYDTDPQFIDQTNGDYRLRPTSPCINGGVKTGIQVIQDKYPSAIWFDSAHTGTESGTVDEPYNTIGEAMTAASSGGVIAIKEGTHNVTQITLSKSLTFVGESTKAVLSTSGNNYGGAINARNTSHSIKIETLKVYHNSPSNTYGLIAAGNVAGATVTVEGCILEMGPSTLSATNNRGWFSGHSSPITSLTVSDSVILGGTSSSSYGVVVGGDYQQDGFNLLDFQSNTIVVTGGSANKFSSYSAGITSSTFKNNIFVGNGNSETLGFTPPTASHNCYHNNGINSGNAPDSEGGVFADPQFIDQASGDLRLRPTSPCIDAGTN